MDNDLGYVLAFIIGVIFVFGFVYVVLDRPLIVEHGYSWQCNAYDVDNSTITVLKALRPGDVAGHCVNWVKEQPCGKCG